MKDRNKTNPSDGGVIHRVLKNVAVLIPLGSGLGAARSRSKILDQPVQHRLLVPLVIVLLLLVSGFGLTLFKTQQEDMNQSSQQVLEDAANELYISLAKQSQAIATFGELILRDTDMRDALNRQDRQALLAAYVDVFARLREQYGITHFYFHRPDRVNLLRVHKPKKFGDLIDRFTAREAERTGKTTSGIELGPLGTFTLRVVLPVLDGNTPVGYLELGKEIEDILTSIHDEHGTELALTIHKRALKRSQWEEGMAMLGRKGNWDRFSDEVLIYTSLPRFPEEWGHFVAKDGHTRHTQTAFTDLDGKSWHILASPLIDVSGTVVGDLFFFLDVSETMARFNRLLIMVSGAGLVLLITLLGFLYVSLRRVDQKIHQQQVELVKSEERYDLALSVANDGIWDWHLDDNSVLFDARYYTMAGYEPDEFPSGFEEWQKRVHPDDFPVAELAIKRYLAGESETFNVEFRFMRKDGDYMWIQGRGKIVARDGIGNPSRFIGTHSDITERKEAEKEKERLQRELQQARKIEALGQLTGGIAHDFNNILGIIIGNASMCLDRYGGKIPEKMMGYLETVLKASDRAKDLVAQLLTFSRAGDVVTKPLQLTPLVKENAKMLGSILPSSIRIELNCEEGLPSVLMDPAQLQQLMMNLCVNAKDAMDGVGSLTIGLGWSRGINDECSACHTHIEGDWIELSVADTGSGMTSETLEHLFEPFYTTKDVGKGTGMGMAVLLGIVRGHGGHVLVETEPGKGTTIRLLFPPVVEKKQATPDETVQSTDELPRGTGRHVLVVDDEPALAEYIGDLLELNDYQVTIQTDSQEALSLFREEPDKFSLLITDQTMPGLTGVELIKQLREIRAELPAILCTGYSEGIAADDAENMDIRYLGKPIDSDILVQSAGELLRLTK